MSKDLSEEQQPLTFKKGKIPRNELELPTLHFVVVDQWLEVIGEKALISWLKMYSWADRDLKTKEETDVNLWDQAKIPTSFTQLMKKLGVSRKSFYNNVIRPLWNVGLIDIEEYELSENKGQKPMNIIVYKYPQNNIKLAHEPLKEIRNYDKDYHSKAKTFAKKGGRPKKSAKNPTPIKGVFPEETGGVSLGNRGVFFEETGGGFHKKHNNIFNSFTNSFNSITNILNSFNNIFNSSSSNSNINRLTGSSDIKNIKEEEEDPNKLRNDNVAYDVLAEFLSQKKRDTETINQTIIECHERDLDMFTMEDIQKQYDFMMKKKQNGERIFDFAKYFANGLKELTKQTNANKIHHYEKQKEHEMKMKQVQERKNNLPYYNWLEE